MRSFLGFFFHLIVGMLCVPFLALFCSAGLLWPVLHLLTLTATSAQQFYSNHLFALVAITAVILGYLVSDTFTVKGAEWVWIPALIVLVIRIVFWRWSGSVLYSQSVIGHFVTANCQIQDWRDPNFGTRCGDELFLMQLVIGGCGYSVGATIFRLKARFRPHVSVINC